MRLLPYACACCARSIESRLDSGRRWRRVARPGTRGGEGLRRLTFVIPSYNYEAYIGQAIESALAVRWPDVEVIVVDDGSTDRSVHIVEGFADRVQLIRQSNAGPRVACNVGFAASTGDWVVFLDADDAVGEDIGVAIDKAERPGLSKIQFQMQRINADDRPVGRPFPAYTTVPTPSQVRAWMRATASYPTPPGSGNAYPRTFLERLFPLDDRCGDATDSACLAAAPFYGDVLTIAEPMVRYRVHGKNRSYLLGDVERFSRQLERALQRHEFAQTIDGRRGDGGWMKPLFRGRHLLQLRVAHHRMTKEPSPLPGDSFGRMLADSLLSPARPGPEGPLRRAFLAAFCVAVLLAPRRLAVHLIKTRFAQPY